MNIINTNLKLFKNIDEYYSYDIDEPDAKIETIKNEELKHNILYENQILHNPIDINTRFEKIEKNICDTQALLNEAISVLDQKEKKTLADYDVILTHESFKKKFRTRIIPKFIYKLKDTQLSDQKDRHPNKEILFKNNETDFLNQFGEFTHETKKYFEIIKYLINQNDDIDVSSFYKLIQFIDNTDEHLNDQTIPYIWNFFVNERDKQINLAFNRIKNTQEFIKKDHIDITQKANLLDKEILSLFEKEESNEFDLDLSDEFDDELDKVDDIDEELTFNLIETIKAIESGKVSWLDTYEDELITMAEKNKN